MFHHLSTEVDSSGVALVRLNRPPVNGVDDVMYRELKELFSDPDALGGDPRVIVLTGEGPYFCAGNDLAEFATMTPANGEERMWRVREAFFAILECPLPVIAAVHGVALGTGLAIAASCDFIVAEPGARFGLPELTVGVMGGARHLARIAPQPLVRRMFLTGEQLSPAQMTNAGASLFISEPGAHLEEARRLALRIAGLSPTAVRLGKHILNRIETMDVRTGYAFEQRFTVAMSGHPDSKEALAAFQDKRPPVYLELDETQDRALRPHPSLQ